MSEVRGHWELAVADIDDIGSRAPVAVFGVGPELKIVSWNEIAEAQTGRSKQSVLGGICYEVMGAVDVETGRPCYEQCPLLAKGVRRGWVHSRILEAPWRDGQPAQLDCMLLHYLSPSAERGALCFVTPLGAEDARYHLRVSTALQDLYVVMGNTQDRSDRLASIARIALEATGADIVELQLLGPTNREPARALRLTPDGGASADFGPRPLSAGFRDLIARSDGTLVAIEHPLALDDDQQAHWDLIVPVVTDGRLLGTMRMTSASSTFSIGQAARALFAISGQLSLYLRWEELTNRESARLNAERMSATPTLRFYLLGRFRIVREHKGEVHEIPASQFHRRLKALTLLKILAAHRRKPLHREALIEYLWPDADPVLAANNFRVVLHELRHILEPDLTHGQTSTYVIGHGELVYLDASNRCWLDIEEFEQRIRKLDALLRQSQVDAALAEGEAAVALYSADFIEDEPYVDWCVGEREQLREIYIDLLLRMANAYVIRNRLEDAIVSLRRSLAADPIREQTHRRLMTVLAQAGRRAEAIRHYELCRRVLWDELAVKPDRETENIYRSIALASSSRTDRSRPPPDVTPA